MHVAYASEKTQLNSSRHRGVIAAAEHAPANSGVRMKAGTFRALCALVPCLSPIFAHAQHDDAERLRIHGPLAISDGGIAVYPTHAEIRSENYPLLRRYSLRGGQRMSALGRSFALFSMTRPAQVAVERAGHFAAMLRPAPRTPVLEGGEACRGLVAGAERLPLSLDSIMTRAGRCSTRAPSTTSSA